MVNGVINGMSTTVQIDRAGRLVLPKRLRERFRLQRGDTLALEVKGDIIELRPQKTRISLERVNGILVVASENQVDPNIVERFRDEKIDEIASRARPLE